MNQAYQFVQDFKIKTFVKNLHALFKIKVN